MNYKLFDSEEQRNKVQQIQQQDIETMHCVKLQLGIRKSVVHEMRSFVIKATQALKERRTK